MIQKKEEEKVIINAFKYVSYGELTNQILKGKYSSYKKLIKKKLGNKYNIYFDNLRNNINDQEKFANQIQSILNDLGFFEKTNPNNSDKETSEESNDSTNDESKNDYLNNQLDEYSI